MNHLTSVCSVEAFLGSPPTHFVNSENLMKGRAVKFWPTLWHRRDKREHRRNYANFLLNLSDKRITQTFIIST